MKFLVAFTDELTKIGFSKEDLTAMLAAPGFARESGKAAGGEAAKKLIEEGRRVGKKAAPTAAGLGIGGLIGRVLGKRTALGALAGLGVVHRKKVMEAAKEGGKKAKEYAGKAKERLSKTGQVAPKIEPPKLPGTITPGGIKPGRVGKMTGGLTKPPEMKVQQFAPGTAQARAVAKKVKTLRPVKSQAQIDRAQALKRSKLMERVTRQPSPTEGGGMTLEQAQALAKKLRESR